VERLDQWAAEQRTVIFLTNAPRPSDAVRAQLSALGLPDRLNKHVVSSGDTALAWIREARPSLAFSFLGSEADAFRLVSAGLHLSTDMNAESVICTGFDERGFDLMLYRQQLQEFAKGGAEMLCFNPDRVVHRGVEPEPCAGAIGAAYEEMGGIVRQFGKPHAQIYDHAIRYAGGQRGSLPERRDVLAIGDSLATDFVGAINAGLDFVFIAGGIDETAYRAGPDCFSAAKGLKEPDRARPVAVVQCLGDIREI
jgi:HAD superfamily hydrolase (TIGR01459 family)